MENITPFSLPTEIWEEAAQENELVNFKRDYETGSPQAWGQNVGPINTGGAYLRNKLNQHQAEEWVTKQSHFTCKSLSSGRLALTWLLARRLNTQISSLRRSVFSETCLAREYWTQLWTWAWLADLWTLSPTPGCCKSGLFSLVPYCGLLASQIFHVNIHHTYFTAFEFSKTYRDWKKMFVLKGKEDSVGKDTGYRGWWLTLHAQIPPGGKRNRNH